MFILLHLDRIQHVDLGLHCIAYIDGIVMNWTQYIVL